MRGYPEQKAIPAATATRVDDGGQLHVGSGLRYGAFATINDRRECICA